MRIVLFDVDYTLTRSTHVDTGSYLYAFEKMFGVKPHEVSTDWNDYEHATDEQVAIEIFRENMGREPKGEEIEQLKAMAAERLRAYLDEDRSHCKAVPGAIAFIEELLKREGWFPAIATGGWGTTARVKLKHAGIPFERLPIASSCEGVSRESIIEEAIQRAKGHYESRELAPHVYFGDAPWDVHTTRNMGIPFVGIGEHDHQRQKLTDLGAKNVIENYTDLERIFSLLEELSQRTPK